MVSTRSAHLACGGSLARKSGLGGGFDQREDKFVLDAPLLDDLDRRLFEKQILGEFRRFDSEVGIDDARLGRSKILLLICRRSGILAGTAPREIRSSRPIRLRGEVAKRLTAPVLKDVRPTGHFSPRFQLLGQRTCPGRIQQP
jgi:hypothetical protein